MDNAEIIRIVVACDDHYCIMLGTLLKSIENNNPTNHFEIYIVDDKVSKKSRTKLIHTISANRFHLVWIKMEEAIPTGMSFPLVKNSYPLNTYIRLFIPYFIPRTVKKVLFLDVDMIVLGNINDLWNINLGISIIGAVQDSITKYVGNLEGGGILNYKELNLNPKAKYFNAGLLLINTEEWLKNEVTKNVIDSINQNATYASMGDQYGLNVVLAEKWLELDPLWNFMANDNHPSPYLIHFIHRKPFYKSYTNNPRFKKIFYEVLNQTEWKNQKPIGESRRYIKKMENVLQKIKLVFNKKGSR